MMRNSSPAGPLFSAASNSPELVGIPDPRVYQVAKLIRSDMKRQFSLPQLAHAGEIDPSSFIVAAHGDQFVVTAFTSLPAAQRPPADRDGRLYWLLNQLDDRRPMPGSILIAKNDKSTILLVEDQIVNQQLKDMDQLGRRLLFSVNPHLSRMFGSGLPANSPQLQP